MSTRKVKNTKKQSKKQKESEFLPVRTYMSLDYPILSYYLANLPTLILKCRSRQSTFIEFSSVSKGKTLHVYSPFEVL